MRTGSWTARVALSIALVCAAMFAAWCQELPAADPAALGFSAERLARLGSSLESAVKAERIPGAVVLVARHGKVAYFETFGQQNHESGAPMRRDSIFRIYSMTKPIVSVAVMTLWEEGRFDLDDPIGKYLSEFSNMQVAGVQKDASGKPSVVLEPARRAPTIQQLLTHTGGLSYDTLPKGPDYPVRQMYVDAGIGNPEDSLAEMVAKIAGLPLAYQPGTVWEYSRSVDVLARLVEVVSGQPIDRFLASRIFVPLGMKDTGFWVPKDKLDRLAEGFANDRMIDVTKPPKLMSGNYGLVSTAEDYFRFEQMLINGGTFNGVRILGPRTVAYMTSDQIGAIRGPFYGPGPGYGFGLGFAVRLTEGQAPYAGTVGDYGWQGTAGTIFWVDPKEDLTAVLMVQRVGSFVHNSQLTRALVYQALN